MQKIDYKKTFKDLYSAKADPKTITAPRLNYITVVGQGNPNTSIEFKNAVEALYGLAYTIKFMVKKGETQLSPIDFTVMPLEGQWWSDNMDDFVTHNKDSWKWKIMLLMPEFITIEIYNSAKEKLKSKKNPVALELVSFEEIEDGLAAQIMHLGSYDHEHETIQKLHNYIESQGYKLSGFHREIYLSDLRKTAPEKLKTIIRQPMV